jgi:hypothetical protein
MMKRLTTVISCTAIAVLCSGCQPQVLWERFNCSVTKNLFEDMKERTSKGEGPLGFKIYENEAEIKRVLEADTEHYSNLWKENNCPGSITEQHWMLRHQPFNFFAF